MDEVREREVRREQERLDVLYARLDRLTSEAARSLEDVRRSRASDPSSRTTRDALDTFHSERLAALRAAEERLCFGRLDRVDAATHYVGRIGLSAPDGDQLLVDWRAPAAEPFYQATAARPLGVLRRRHLSTRDRRVTAVEDDVLDLDRFDPSTGFVSGEGALLVALNAARTGRMHDIVSTIQAEQDQVIRSPLPGVLVVQGGPGTGKTAVALHRAAYLLYTHRERLGRSGVLLVGPNATFLRYVEQVLPSLGETGVVMSTPSELYPGVVADGVEPDRVAALKGDLRMVDVLRRAVEDLQRLPSRPVRLDVEGTRISLRPADVRAARTRARSSRKPHNEARVVFVKDLLKRLAASLAEARRLDVEEHRDDLVADLRAAPDVRRELNRLWPPVTPERLLSGLYASPARLARTGLAEGEQLLLWRERSARWTPADVPLLDEAAELLGVDPSVAEAEAARARAESADELSYAREALRGLGSNVSAEDVLGRYAGTGPSLSVSERAGSDRTWAFGHVVVDEAQELSPMMWRLLFRRCPSRSMTVVGDTAQTGSAAGASSWADVFDVFAPGRWRVEELSVNYRTPREVMDLASGLLTAHGVPTSTALSARDGAPPVTVRTEVGDLAEVVRVVSSELSDLSSGRLAVVSAGFVRDELHSLLSDTLGVPVASGRSLSALDSPVAVLTPSEAKGLEFDVVVVVGPSAILGSSARGVSDLYVVLTRPTQRLVVVHSADLPAGLDSAAR